MLLMLGAAIATPAAQCRGVPVRAMIARYAALQQQQKVDDIARLFGTDGVVDNPGAAPIRGETAVKALLKGFKGFVVTSNTLTIGEVTWDRDAWHVTGHFHQTGRTPEPKDYDVSGSFDSLWTCGPHGWRVRRMATGK